MKPSIHSCLPISRPGPCFVRLVQVLSYSESGHPPTIVAVMAPLAGVRQALSNPGQLIVPLQLHHVAGRGLAGVAHCYLGPQLVVIIQHPVFFFLSQPSCISCPARSLRSLVPTQCVVRCYGAVVVAACMSYNTHHKQNHIKHADLVCLTVQTNCPKKTAD